jgi:iron complex transport system ATP-binding protein
MLTLESLSISYGPRVALRNVSLQVTPGEVMAVIGPNGAGKSTLIRAASGGLAPTQGRALLAGLEAHRLPPDRRARRVAVVPQAARLPEAFTVWETVLMGRTPYLGWLARESRADHALAQAAMRRANVADLAERCIGELSGGEQQRVLIARALAQAAPILLMDEPTAHLDLKHQVSLLSLARDLAHQEKLVVLVALHDLNLAAQFADRVALLVGGELRTLGLPAEVLTASNLSTAYDLAVNVIAHPAHGTPLVIANF